MSSLRQREQRKKTATTLRLSFRITTAYHLAVDGYHHIGVFMHDNVEVDAFRGWVEDVSVVLLRPRNGFFDVGCIYGRHDDHVRFGFSASQPLYLGCDPSIKRSTSFTRTTGKLPRRRGADIQTVQPPSRCTTCNLELDQTWDGIMRHR